MNYKPDIRAANTKTTGKARHTYSPSGVQLPNLQYFRFSQLCHWMPFTCVIAENLDRMALIGGMCNPLKILSAIIMRIAIFVVDFVTVRAGAVKSPCHKTVHRTGFRKAIFAENNHSIPSLSTIWPQNASGHCAAPLCDTFNMSQATNFVNTFIARNIAPVFRFVVHVYLRELLYHRTKRESSIRSVICGFHLQ